MSKSKLVIHLCQVLAVASLLVSASIAQADPAPGYYDTVDTTDATTLRTTLHDVIDDHTRVYYTSSTKTDVWDVIDEADEDPNNPDAVLDIYANKTYAKAGGGNDFYHREHSWPKSYGFPKDVVANFPYTDCHHLWVADGGYNSSRSNKPYNYCSDACDEKPTIYNDGAGGGTGVYPGNSNWTSGAHETGSWETWVGRRGDVARALLYMDVRYEGDIHSIKGVLEPDLILTDDPTLLVADTTANKKVAYMGYLSVLLEWHAQDPVDDRERHRNDVVESYQGNRNPFIDHPEWVAIIFGGGTGPDPEPELADPWINEFHYDNVGTDVGEFVEIAGPVGTDLSGWKVYAYNGSGGGTYANISLSGVMEDQGDCAGAIAFDFAGLQNGPDALALVNDSDEVIDFISYEGTFEATAGPASGMTPVDTVVKETTSTPVGHSIQMRGDGDDVGDFMWSGPESQTPGVANGSQTIAGVCPAEPADPWINEFHYDNAGGDVGEFVEVAGPAGLDLGGWMLYAYNGADGASYDSVSLTGMIPDNGACAGTIAFDFSGLQNGPDAIALVDDEGAVVDFVGYEGSVYASSGPAEGLAGEDIGVKETTSTPIGYSLQRIGTGAVAGDFTWEAPASQTVGADNHGQTISGVCITGGDDPVEPEGDPWINEFHYDDAGTDSQEMVEVAGPAGLNLDGWTVLAYNGSNGEIYKTIDLNGTIADEGAGFGTLSFAAAGLQNGNDALALVSDSSDVIMFISYEGSFDATEGPASGMTAVNLSVAETTSTPDGTSIQLTGTGCAYADFTWVVEVAQSGGTLNAGQTIAGCAKGK